MSRVFGWTVVLVVCAGFIGLLVLASHIGEQLRCERLAAAHSPATQTYDCHTTGAR